MEQWVQVLLGASVRVAGGTGFLLERDSGARMIVTAEHVVHGQKHVSVRWSGGQAVLQVLHSDDTRDIAIVADNHDLASRPALRLSMTPPAPGDSVAYAGYPLGWDDLIPVLQRGWVAALRGDEAWFDGNANPGNSGGPVVLVQEDGSIAVVGVLLARAGNVEQALSQFQSEAHAMDEAAKRFHFPMAMGGVNVIDEILRLSTRGLLSLATLLDRHFRTGLVRAAGLRSIREVLGPE